MVPKARKEIFQASDTVVSDILSGLGSLVTHLPLCLWRDKADEYELALRAGEIVTI